jgi:hypothetical protein
MGYYLLEAISKRPFAPISVLGPNSNSSKYFSMSAGLNSIPRSCPADLQRENLNQNPIFEMASSFFKYGFCFLRQKII